MSVDPGQLLRAIPSVTQFLASAEGTALVDRFGAGVVKLELRRVLDEVRTQLRSGERRQAPSLTALAAEMEQGLVRLCHPIGRRAINATGILLHTGLGRAPLCSDAAQAIAATTHYSLLQASLDSGDRSLREEKIQRFLCELTGGEAVTVVNNNAAATMLILHTLAAGKEVIISRGQLIEIGGSFRMTEVMGQSSAILREVGTTNRTHLRDYEQAIGPNTGAIIHVHTSNYRVRGFASTPDIAQLVQLGKARGIPVIDDLGSGAMVPLRPYGIEDEPLVSASVAAGVDVACFSGDKLICGPQCGILIGRQAIIQKIRKSPWARMFRVCKLTLAALEATLLHFINDTWKEQIPFYRMMGLPLAEIETRAAALAGALSQIDGIARADTAPDISYVGSGSVPDQGIATRIVRIRHRSLAPETLARRLRQGIPTVFGRLGDDAVLFDPRTLLEGEDALVIEAVRRAAAATSAGGDGRGA